MRLAKKKIVTLTGLLLLATITIFAFTACSNEISDFTGGGTKLQVPVYQGMTIASNVNVTESLKAANYVGGHGHKGHYWGDYEGREENADDDSFGSTIDDVIDQTLQIEGSVQPIYYATPNADIYITVHIHNPDSFEIMSFTLNGVKYSSYMFEYGSDMENLILKKNVGNISGIAEYTIDAIKYIDGTEIKDVLYNGDQTVRAGIRVPNQVSATATETVGFNSIGLNVNILDNDGLVAYSHGKCKAVIYDGESLVAERDLKLGDNELTFEGLAINTPYQYAIVGYYDNLETGCEWNTLYKKTFYTKTVVLFDSIDVTTDGLTFGFNWHTNEANDISSLQLVKNGEATALDIKTDGVSGLLSDNDYTLVAKYVFDKKEQEIKLDFHTLAKAVPDLEVNAQSTQEEVTFEVIKTDIDNVGDISKVELLHGNDTPIVAQTTAQRTFANLLSNNAYTVRITYEYDLNDGNGTQTKKFEKAIYTKPKAVTVRSITALGDVGIILGETISLRILLDNPDNVSISSADINGQTTPLISTGTNSNYLVNFVPAKGGVDYISVDGFYYSISGETFCQTATYVSDIKMSVLGNVALSSVKFANGRDYYGRNESLDLILEFIGADDYELKYVSEFTDSNSGYPLTKITSNTYSVSIVLSNKNLGMHNLRLVSLGYGLGEHTSVGTISDCTVNYYISNSASVIDIENVDDLKSMQNYNYYRLVNDIDLSDTNWVPIDFNGYFDGNGHTIDNMSIKRTDTNLPASRAEESLRFGLFGSHSGLIKNLTVNNASIEITSSNMLSEMRLGILVGKSTGDNSRYENCMIKGDVTVICGRDRVERIGGIIGQADSGETQLREAIFEGTILVSAPEIENNIAFLIGDCGHSYNSIAIGSITLLKNNVASVSTALCGWAGSTSDCYYVPENVKITKYTVAFQTNGGCDVSPQTGYVLAGAPATVKAGCRFEGWYLDAELTQPVSYPLFSEKDITLYAKWFDMSAFLQSLSDLPESEGLQIENGIITGIGSCKDEILVLNHPIASRALCGLRGEYDYDSETGEIVYRSGIKMVVIQSGVTSIGFQAFGSCDFETIYFISDTQPQIGEDVFANTWDNFNFRVYVPNALLVSFKNISDGYWQSSIVQANKIVGF